MVTGKMVIDLIILGIRGQDHTFRGDTRPLWTLCGVAIAVLVMFPAGLLAKRSAKAPPQQRADVSTQRKTATKRDAAARSGPEPNRACLATAGR